LKDVYKEFNCSGQDLVNQLKRFREHGVYILGSFIFGLPSDRPGTFEATEMVASQAEIAFAQFVMLTPYPGTVDFIKWEKQMDAAPVFIGDIPITRRWLIPQALRPKLYWPHPTMSGEEVRMRTQAVWDTFYGLKSIWERSRCIKSLRARIAFLMISKIYRQMYADTGIATDSARVSRSARWVRLLAKPCQRLFAAAPIPNLEVPGAWGPIAVLEQTTSAND